jgi:hypothetical protein
MVSIKSAKRKGLLNSMEQKTQIFCQIHVQEFHLRVRTPEI